MKATVLIAEDSTHMRMILKDILIRDGYDVVGEAENGEEAVRMYNELHPDVVTLDIAMPEMDGIAALKAIKNEHPHANEPAEPGDRGDQGGGLGLFYQAAPIGTRRRGDRKSAEITLSQYLN